MSESAHPSRVTRSRDVRRRVGIFGGTFDPIHIGHLIVAEIMHHTLALDRVVFLPAGRPPHKPEQVLSSDVDRLAMLDLALRDDDRFIISRVDIGRAGWSYTVDSLRILQQELGPTTDLHFIMGQDSLRDFPTWHRPADIVQQARLAVAIRPDVQLDMRALYRAVPELQGRVDIVPVPLIGVSSRAIRASVRAGGPYRYQVLPAVAQYIRDTHLYMEE